MTDVVFSPLRAARGDDDPTGIARYQDLVGNRSGRLNDWTCKKTAQAGDLYIFFCGKPVFEVVAIGIHTGEVRSDDTVVDWTKNPVSWFGNFEPFVVLENPLTKTYLRDHPTLSQWWAGSPYRGRPKTILAQPRAAAMLLQRIAVANPGTQKIIGAHLTVARAKSRDSAIGRGRKLRSHKKDKSQLRLARLITRLEAADTDRLYVEVKRALRNQALRPIVLGNWGIQCAFCGSSLKARPGIYEVEIAHVQEVHQKGPDSPRNALPLCRTHHWAFDQNLWAIKPDTNTIFVAKEFRRAESLKGFHGRKLRCKGEISLDKGAVKSRFRAFEKATAE